MIEVSPDFKRVVDRLRFRLEIQEGKKPTNFRITDMIAKDLEKKKKEKNLFDPIF